MYRLIINSFFVSRQHSFIQTCLASCQCLLYEMSKLNVKLYDASLSSNCLTVEQIFKEWSTKEPAWSAPVVDNSPEGYLTGCCCCLGPKRTLEEWEFVSEPRREWARGGSVWCELDISIYLIGTSDVSALGKSISNSPVERLMITQRSQQRQQQACQF